MQLSSSAWAAAFVALMLACSVVLAHPLGKEAEASQDTETAAAAENGKESKSVASTLSKGSKGLTADASSTDEAVLRNERDSGYGVPQSSYGPNTVAETPNNFINVFSQAAANTVNFATQLLNSLVGVAANILQGTVSTLLSLLNAKGQIVGAVVQSAPPVLASVTRTAGDVLAAKARIFGAVTQSAVNFASQLAQTVTTTFSSLFNGPNAINFNALGRRDSDGSASSGIANLGQTIVSSQLNLLNGILSPFVNGGRSGSSSSSSSGSLNPFAALFGGGSGSNPLAALFGGGSGSSPLAALFPSLSRSRSSANSNSDSSSSSESSEPNFRITIGSGGSSGIGSSSPINVPTEPDEEIEQDKETK
ncbi:nuclear pore complex protein DDB_G0274915 isoform X2 [Folsomia candida]|uniref:nuclear pore complex protein DDB_G0274915 isoform X2 n=1 Tax=Folsomia candida TaxID=158441 RepID=UPI000B906A78|nr:nuclear pore complex protein DDB_G0274915 isoform X2 [Folsomia candida]